MRSNKTLKYFSSFVRSAPNLTGKEKEVVVKRLNKKTLQGIGEAWGLTEARIRQIESVAIRKLKSESKQLALFKKLYSNKIRKVTK